MFKPVCLVGH